MTGEISRKHFVIILENSLQEFSCITCCILPSDLTNRFSDKKKKPLTRYLLTHQRKWWIITRFFISSNLWDNLLKGVASLTLPVLALRSILLQSVPRIYANSTPNTRTGVEYLWHKEIQDVPMKSGSAWSRNAVPAVSPTNAGVRNIIFIQATFTTRYEGSERKPVRSRNLFILLF